jgi:hypothetical protein
VGRSVMKLCPTSGYSFTSRATSPSANNGVQLGCRSRQHEVLRAVARDDRARPAQRFNIFRQLTVVGRGRIEHTTWGQLQAESAAHAEPDDAHLSGAPVVGGQMITGSDQVIDGRSLASQLRPQGADHASQLVTTPEKRRRQRQVAVGREAVGDAAKVRGHSQRVVDDHHAGPRSIPRRRGQIRGQRPSGTVVVNVGHWAIVHTERTTTPNARL